MSHARASSCVAHAFAAPSGVLTSSSLSSQTTKARVKHRTLHESNLFVYDHKTICFVHWHLLAYERYGVQSGP